MATEFTVSREGTTLVTLHEGSDTTACDEATGELETSLESLASEGVISDWEIADAEVYEPPTGPFDPYTITVEFTVTVTVSADGEEQATAAGKTAIDDALEEADLGSVSYTTPPTASS